MSERSFVTDTSPLSCRLGYGAIFIGLWDYPHLNGGLYCLKEALSLLVLCVCVWGGGGGGGGGLLSAVGSNATACMQKEKNRKWG